MEGADGVDQSGHDTHVVASILGGDDFRNCVLAKHKSDLQQLPHLLNRLQVNQSHLQEHNSISSTVSRLTYAKILYIITKIQPSNVTKNIDNDQASLQMQKLLFMISRKREKLEK